MGEGISAAIRQPQLHSSYGRQQIAAVKHALGDEWDRKLVGVCRSTGNPAHYRIRALQVMQLFGAPPAKELLLALSRDENANVRAEAATQLAAVGDEESQQRLVGMLADADAAVRRRVCEALLRAGQSAPFEKLTPVLASEDRFESWAARRLVERIPAEAWRQTILTTKEHRLFIQGSVALLTAHGDRETARAVLQRYEQLVGEFVSDRDFIDMLRVAQIALAKGSLARQDVPQLAERLGEEFPSQDHTMNRELVRLLAYLQVATPMDRYLEYLKSAAPDAEKLHLALHLRFLPTGWQDGQRLKLIEFYEQARRRSGGSSYGAYVASVERDFAKSLSSSEGSQVLSRGVEWPGAAVGVLYNLPGTLGADVIDALCDLDRQAAGSDDDMARQLRLGIVAVLARSGAARAMEYLRQAWDEDPERRPFLAMGLAQQPEGTNFEYLLRSLPVLEGDAAQEVLGKLATAEKTTADPEAHRQVILLGLRLQEHGAEEAVAVLNHWKGAPLAGTDSSWQDGLQAWQKWYAEQYPDRQPATLPVAPSDAKWTYDQLLSHLTAHGAQGSPARGAAVFEKAKCARCHRGGGGPDLSSVSRRLAKKEILESLLYPSHRISGPDTTQQSTMPEGLLEELSLEEITDLFAYLGGTQVHKIARERAPDAKR